ncbi:hypothetical protein BLOT_008044 [Blomia tropicalis]|nr:hypothetical protein BLOT_008044 [Blomia tropicalis]
METEAEDVHMSAQDDGLGVNCVLMWVMPSNLSVSCVYGLLLLDNLVLINIYSRSSSSSSSIELKWNAQTTPRVVLVYVDSIRSVTSYGHYV